MKLQFLETTDIFKVAALLCIGGVLERMSFKEHRQQIVGFLVKGEGLHQLDLDYRNGEVLVNPLQFRETLNHLRDVLFTKLREREGRYDDHRKRSNRKSKKRR